jgi:hypothetical protein
MDSKYEPLIFGRESGLYEDERSLSIQDDDCKISTKQQEEDCPCSYHIEDIKTISADELNPIFTNHLTKKPSIPDLFISYSSSPDIPPPPLFAYDNTWGNADEIPTRVPSAALEEEEEEEEEESGFPPLIRCRDIPAMGWYPDDFLEDIDYDYDYDYNDEDDYSVYVDSVVSEWSSFLISMDSEKDGPKDLFYCKDRIDLDIEGEEDESWSVVSQASSTTLPQQYTCCALHAKREG